VRILVAGLVAGVVGLVLFVVELAVALSGNTLTSSGIVLLWLGVGLLVVAGALFLFAVLTSDSRGSAASDGRVPSDG